MKKEINITAIDVQHQRVPPPEWAGDERPLWAVRLSRYRNDLRGQPTRALSAVRIVRADNVVDALSTAQAEEEASWCDEEGNQIRPSDTWLYAEGACKVEDIPPPRVRLWDRTLKKGDTPPDAGRVVGHTGSLNYPADPVSEDGAYLYWKVEEMPADSGPVVASRDLRKEEDAA